MACFRPLTAFQDVAGGPISFGKELRNGRELRLPCGRCIGCRQVRQRAWALRCMHEAAMHDVSSFITLTYEGDCDPSLNYRDFQWFMYRLRRRVGPRRFFMCGEYGEMGLRPHFHAIVFGEGFPDRQGWSGDMYRSPVLESLWPFGFSSVGEVTYESAAYVARYALKKVTGDRAISHYCRVDSRTGEYVYVSPEFGHMSLKPGIGYTWFQKFWRDVYAARDGVVMKGGRVVPPPRYYDKLLVGIDEDLMLAKSVDRYERSKRFIEDSTPERLLVREHCAKARLAFKKERL